MMTIDMIRADLALRGWVHVWTAYRKPVEGGFMFIGGGMSRPSLHAADWPQHLADPAPIDDDVLYRLHDIIVRY